MNLKQMGDVAVQLNKILNDKAPEFEFKVTLSGAVEPDSGLLYIETNYLQPSAFPLYHVIKDGTEFWADRIVETYRELKGDDNA